MHIFLAFPFSELCDKNIGTLKSQYINFLNNVRNDLIHLGHSVFLAHYREKWGKELMGPMECTPADYEEMKRADLVISFPGSPISGGVHIELGWASSLGKRILLFLKEDQPYSPLILGLETICDVQIVRYQNIFDHHIREQIIYQVNHISIAERSIS